MIRPVLAAVFMTALAAPALAQDAEPQDVLANYGSAPWSFAFGAATDNRSKDASKSDGNPFVWGEAVWETSDGFFYAGPAFETIDSSTGSNLETDIGVGLRPQFAGFDLDLNATHKWQINADQGADDDAWEFTADVSRSIGPAGGSSAPATLARRHGLDGGLDLVRGARQLGFHRQTVRLDGHRSARAGQQHRLHRLERGLHLCPDPNP